MISKPNWNENDSLVMFYLFEVQPTTMNLEKIEKAIIELTGKGHITTEGMEQLLKHKEEGK